MFFLKLFLNFQAKLITLYPDMGLDPDPNWTKIQDLAPNSMYLEWIHNTGSSSSTHLIGEAVNLEERVQLLDVSHQLLVPGVEVLDHTLQDYSTIRNRTLFCASFKNLVKIFVLNFEKIYKIKGEIICKLFNFYM